MKIALCLWGGNRTLPFRCTNNAAKKKHNNEGVKGENERGQHLGSQKIPVSLHVVAPFVLNANLTRLLVFNNRFGFVQCHDRIGTPPDDYCRDQLMPLWSKVDATPFGIRCKEVYMKLSTKRQILARLR